MTNANNMSSKIDSKYQKCLIFSDWMESLSKIAVCAHYKANYCVDRCRPKAVNTLSDQFVTAVRVWHWMALVLTN